MVHWYGFHYQHTKLRPSLYGHEVGNHIKFTRLHLGSLALRPISLSLRNSRPLIAQTPLLRTTKAYGQLLGRDFNPLAKLLLLRTSDPSKFMLIAVSTQFPTRGFSVLGSNDSVNTGSGEATVFVWTIKSVMNGRAKDYQSLALKKTPVLNQCDGFMMCRKRLPSAVQWTRQ